MCPHISATDNLRQDIARTIHAYDMIPARSRVLIGVSGGPDSICLWHLLMGLAHDFNIRIGVAHLNHGLRAAESERDVGFVRELAEFYNTPLFYQKANIRSAAEKSRRSIEEAGRMARYEFFRETAAAHGFDKIALGHHRDDNAEQVLMNLLRGAGLDGLGGIPPVRGRFIRPLIRVRRKDILSYLAENRLEYMTDQTNADTLFMRNKVRHQLMPLLEKEFNPKIAESLNRLSEICRSEKEWIDRLVFETLLQATRHQDKNQLMLSISGLKELHQAHLRRLVRTGIRRIKGDLRRIRLAQIDAAVGLIDSEKAMGWCDLPGRIRIEKQGDQLIIRQASQNLRETPSAQAPPAYEYAVQLADLPVELFIPEIQKKIMVSASYEKTSSETDCQDHSCAVFDLDRLQFPLIVRNPRPGDRFTPLGMKGSQKLKNYFINNKVPRPARWRYPVLVSGNEIIWIAGHRIADSVKVTQTSQKLIKTDFKTSWD
jgi:tRNA(Ile)-lysidine synthase